MSLQTAGGAALIDQSRGSSRFVSIAYQISTYDDRVDGAEFHPVWPPYYAPLCPCQAFPVHSPMRCALFWNHSYAVIFPWCECPDRDSTPAHQSS